MLVIETVGSGKKNRIVLELTKFSVYITFFLNKNVDQFYFIVFTIQKIFQIKKINRNIETSVN